VVNAFVPLANMFGYVNSLRGMSRAARSSPCSSSHYDTVPQVVADEVIKKYA
jgi:elongation factor G